MLAGVPSQILKQGCLFDWVTPHTCCMSVCMSCMHNAGAIVSTTSAVSMYEEMVCCGTEIKHWALLRWVWLSGWGSCPVCNSGRSPTVSGSLIPRRFIKCSGTGLHGNGTAGSPGRGSMILRAGPEILFFIAMCFIAILFTTPSLSQWKVGSVSELLGEQAK